MVPSGPRRSSTASTRGSRNHGGSPSAFLGVTRSDAPEQLAGINLDLRGKSPYQRFLLASQASADSGQAEGRQVYLVSTQAWVDLQIELGNKVVLTKSPAATVGGMNLGVEYDAIRLVGPAGSADVIADPWMPVDVERYLCVDTFTKASCGEFFHWDDDATPNGPMLEDAADAREVRAVGDQQLYCDNPWPNVRVQTA